MNDENFPGILNITDEGIQRITFRAPHITLDAYQQSMLRTFAGVSFFRVGENEFTDKFIETISKIDEEPEKTSAKVGKALSKLQKRLISQISPRGVSFEDEEISEALAKVGKNASLEKIYDPTDLLLRVAAGERLEGLDALLMAKHGRKRKIKHGENYQRNFSTER